MDRPAHSPLNRRRSDSTQPSTGRSEDHHRENHHSQQLAIPSPAPTTSPQTQTRGPGAGLNEFRSLLEAAQRIADRSSLGPDNNPWPDEESPDPVIRRSSGADDFRRRVPLTRAYSGRPHVPGEDSGSETDEDVTQHNSHHVQRLDIDMSSGRSEGDSAADARHAQVHRDLLRTARLGAERVAQRDNERETEEARQAIHRAASRLRLNRERSEERHTRRSEVLGRPAQARTGEGTTYATRERERYATTGPSPVRESFYDWAPEPQDAGVSANSAASTLTRERSNSVRRWRPAERLQDYASSHARRDSANENSVTDRTQNPTEEDRALSWTRLPSVPRPSAEFGDHTDIVNRVERALQEYRMARRALRPEREGALHDPASATSSTGGLVYRPPYVPPASRFRAAAQNVNDSLNMMQDAVNQRTSGEGDSTLGGPERQRIELRQQLRDQNRERRTRQRMLMVDVDNEHREQDMASGPLFDGNSETPTADRWRADTRRLLDKVRRAEARAKSKEFKLAKAALDYLSRLRDEDMTSVKAWKLAAELGLHNRSLEEEPEKNLPMSVDSLPRPAFSSWLEPGMTWTGTQSADENQDTSSDARPRAVLEARRRTIDQQERVEHATRQNESFRTRMQHGQDPLERTILGNNNTQDALSVARNSMQVLEDAERTLSSMLERSERLLRENERQLQENEEQLARNRRRLRLHDEQLARLSAEYVGGAGDVPNLPQRVKTRDRWNVKVALHEIDWEKMTLNGTMTAWHTPHTGPESEQQRKSSETSMDSFFTGEIIDFLQHGLDTPAIGGRSGKYIGGPLLQRKLQQDDWKVGGPEIDLIYWAGIGPFRREIDTAMEKRRLESQQEARKPELDRLGSSVSSPGNATTTTVHSDKTEPQLPSPSTTSHDIPTLTLTEDEKHDIKLRTMHSLLTDTTWLNQNINQAGWLLMRWKERCFVAPGTQPNPEPTRPWIPSRGSASVEGHAGSEPVPTAFEDAMEQRDTQQRARHDARVRVYTTNAAERDEIAGGGGGGGGGGATSARQQTWGLTISGFYYVALHRGTGGIEALYFDSGSAPFQTLRMGVETAGGGWGGELVSRGGDGEGGEGEGVEGDARGWAGGSRSGSGSVSGGLRTGFGVVEFR